MKSPAAKTSHLRIIGGEHRSRQITFVDTQDIRPTPNRVRETLFNWLQNKIFNAHCLDAFAGSGALSFEAASRGAASIVAIEQHAQFAAMIQENKDKLALNQLHIICDSFFHASPKLAAEKKFDIIFLDPPFHQNFLLDALQAIIQHKILAPQGIIYFEVEKEFDLSTLPPQTSIEKNQTAGQVCYGLLSIKLL